MKTFTATVEVEFTCTDEEMVRDRIIGLPFGNHDLGFRIVGIKEGQLPDGTDETLLPEYRTRHGLEGVPHPRHKEEYRAGDFVKYTEGMGEVSFGTIKTCGGDRYYVKDYLHRYERFVHHGDMRGISTKEQADEYNRIRSTGGPNK